jgi:hypothetical protein
MGQSFWILVRKCVCSVLPRKSVVENTGSWRPLSENINLMLLGERFTVNNMPKTTLNIIILSWKINYCQLTV